MPRPKLKKGDISLREVYLLSKEYYKKKRPEGDNKKKRAKLDVLSAKVITRNNLRYNRSTFQWEQTGRDVEIICMIRTDPKSYIKNDTIKIHKYPVTFLIHDISKGLDSPFRWRTGSNYRPKFPKKGDNKKRRLQLINDNIKKGIQLQFFFELEFVSAKYGTLFGPNRTNAPPSIANKKLELFFDKHALFCFENIIVKLLKLLKGKLLNKTVVNEYRKKG